MAILLRPPGVAMESDEEATGPTKKMPMIQGLEKRVVEEVIPQMISAWALPPGVKPIDMPVKPQLDPWVFFREVLKNPRHIMAPMVDGSDLSYRLLARRYNTHVTFTPMIHSYSLISPRFYYTHSNIIACLLMSDISLKGRKQDSSIFLPISSDAFFHCS